MGMFCFSLDECGGNDTMKSQESRRKKTAPSLSKRRNVRSLQNTYATLGIQKEFRERRRFQAPSQKPVDNISLAIWSV
jgi:hypothetical protein